ncbi:hypothetical protein F5984_09625 [Rudanella paleaurantiibacter]|uniref:Outer membrane beta-barrel protein n=1 Tax=Rudanella paleaurantiibacter TaxID=2614655 RepID=A0A7J5U0A1_9BACT|nr:hypothetical protein [Rudanella paleaurantiibacter]KAB7731067.1 hypothetical protein F5984_09625 [Rudanella paleaurantiibacter]
MKKIMLALCALLSIQAYAQGPVSTRIRSGLDVGFAFKKDNYAPSLTYFQLMNIGRNKVISVGWTSRLAKFYGDNLNLYTAPASLTRGKTGFEALGAPLTPATIDTARFDFITNTSLNFGIRVQVQLGPVELGGSADLFGLTFGKTRVGRMIASAGAYKVESSRAGVDSLVYFTGDNRLQSFKPTRGSVRLLGDNDIGNLAAELYARVRVGQRLSIKGGYQWQTAEMSLRDIRPIDGNRRFRHRTGMPFVAVTFPFFN